MRERGEPLDDATKSELYRRYYSALNDSETRGRMLAAIPPAQQLELQRTLLEWADLEPYKKQTVKALQAFTLEASSNREDALAAWKEFLAEAGSEPGSTLAARARERSSGFPVARRHGAALERDAGLRGTCPDCERTKNEA